MIVEERMRTFLNALDQEHPGWLLQIERQAIAEQVPVIRRETGSFLRFLLAVHRPASILEVGTAVGYSALWMSEYMPADGHITTVEKCESRAARARENFERAGRSDRITLLCMDAMEALDRLEGPFGFVFMDAAKGQYLRFLPKVLRLLAPSGLLVSDNVLQEGDILESRYMVTRRDRTIHARMREYLYELKRHPALETAVLPVGDGVAVSYRREDGKKAGLSDEQK